MSLDFILDTGSTVNVLNPMVAQELALPVVGMQVAFASRQACTSSGQYLQHAVVACHQRHALTRHSTLPPYSTVPGALSANVKLLVLTLAPHDTHLHPSKPLPTGA